MFACAKERDVPEHMMLEGFRWSIGNLAGWDSAYVTGIRELLKKQLTLKGNSQLKSRPLQRTMFIDLQVNKYVTSCFAVL